MTLNTDGYVIIKNCVDTNIGTKCISNGKLDYHCIKNAIDSKYFPTISKHISNSNDATFRRFIFNNNNVSSADSLYHANTHNNSNDDQVSIYSAYIYFSSGSLEIIPNSHLKSSEMNNKGIVLNLNEGDVVILNTNLINRDIYVSSCQTLKILDIFPDKKTYDMYSHNLLVVQLNRSLIIKYIMFVFRFICRFKLLMEGINFIYYSIVYYGLQYFYLLEDYSASSKIGKLISYENNGRKHIDDISNAEHWNLHIICDDNITTKFVGNLLTMVIALGLIFASVCIYFFYQNKNVREFCYNLYDKYYLNAFR